MDFKKYLSAGSADPKQILKFVLGFAAVMLVLWLIMVSRMDFTGTGDPATTEARERGDSLRSAITRNEGQPQNTETAQKSPNIFFNALTTFVILITILGLVWFWSRTKGNSTERKKGMFNELGGQMLGQGAQMKVIEINNEIWIMAISEGSVNLLHRYSKDEWMEEMEAKEPVETNFYKMFKGNQK